MTSLNPQHKNEALDRYTAGDYKTVDERVELEIAAGLRDHLYETIKAASATDIALQRVTGSHPFYDPRIPVNECLCEVEDNAHVGAVEIRKSAAAAGRLIVAHTPFPLIPFEAPRGTYAYRGIDGSVLGETEGRMAYKMYGQPGVEALQVNRYNVEIESSPLFSVSQITTPLELALIHAGCPDFRFDTDRQTGYYL